MPTLVVVGAQWGDEGKGKIVDLVAERADVVVRYSGGANAGHTLRIGGRTLVTHLLPSGVMHPRARCIVGPGTVIDPALLLAEMDSLTALGLEVASRLIVSDRAHATLPFYTQSDRAANLGPRSIGTTGRGIGPTYSEKAARHGLRMRDIADLTRARDLLGPVVEAWRERARAAGMPEPTLEGTLDWLRPLADRIAPLLGDAPAAVYEAVHAGQTVVFEGAQGTLLDLDHGTYPFVTSSSTVAGSACTGSGVGPTEIDAVLGITKAYTTRVGHGPFPTEVQGPEGDALREAGHEYGATTGRPRRCGWLDLPALRYAARVNGLTGLAVTKLDVLTGLSRLLVCEGYRVGARETRELPIDDLGAAVPILREMEGWREPIGKARRVADLPPAARRYLEAMEREIGVPVRVVSVGPDREETIPICDVFTPPPRRGAQTKEAAVARSISQTPSRALAELRLLPRLTTPESIPEKVSLRAPLVTNPRTGATLHLNIPVAAAAMQAVSGPAMGIALAKQGGAALVFCSQAVAAQAEMVARIKRHKAGFVEPCTVSPEATLGEVAELSRQNGFSVFPVVDDAGMLVGLLTRNDYDLARHAGLKVKDRMIPRSRLEVGVELTDLSDANALLLDGHHSVLPVVDRQGRLVSLVFKKDIEEYAENPLQVADDRKRLIAAAAINTHDYEERVPALVEAGADLLAVDSSDGFSFYQQRALEWLAARYPELPVIGGNVVTADGFDFLVKHGAGAVKVGMGSGTICITQEQKGTGRGLATAVMDVCAARDRHHERTGRYVPVVADGGVVTAKDIVIALALGADTVVMGRYFARMEESPSEKVVVNGRVMKAYWGEGSARARDWKAARYGQGTFVEGVEGLVEYAGKLADNLPETLAMIRSSMASCGCATIAELHADAQLELVSALSIREGQVHDIYMPRTSPDDDGARGWGV